VCADYVCGEHGRADEFDSLTLSAFVAMLEAKLAAGLDNYCRVCLAASLSVLVDREFGTAAA
jgi:hypothetical protein